MQKEKPMKKKYTSEMDDELRREYDLRKLLKHGVRGKYVERYRAGTNLVLLAPDVAKAFPNEAAVNEALRALAKIALPPKSRFAGHRRVRRSRKRSAATSTR